MQSHRPIQATIHAAALRHNLAVVRRHAPDSRVMAVVKANGYGHGLLRVASALNEADGFAVLGINEAIALREAGFQQKLLLLEGLFDARELPLALRYNLDVVVHCEEQLLMLEANKHAGSLDVHLKVNTGMNRLGVPTGRFWGIFDRLEACKSAGKITLMTHFATADEEAGVAAQFELFDTLTSEISAPRSMANSAAILRYPHTHAEWVRPGIMLYGTTPVSGTSAAQYGLQPAMTFSSAIIAVQQLQTGDNVGYGHQFTADKPTRVGIVACGYADGYPRHAPGGTPIAVAGKIARTLGRVSMDMLFADLSDIPEAGIGSPVELWGKQIAVDTVAEASGTVGYELLCAIAPRVAVLLEE
jgi:alanine racemase